MNAWGRWLRAEGSTRSAALIRIGLALLIWARFAPDLAPYRLPPAMHPLGIAAFFAASTAMLVGAWSRLSTAATGAILLGMVYGIGPSSHAPWTHHHTTLLAHATALLGLTECGRSYSLDRWWAVRRAERAGAPPPPERGPTWGLGLIAVQLTVMYLSTALDKSTWAFLSGERLQHAFHVLYWGADPVDLPGFAAATRAAAWAVWLLEIAIPLGMWFRRLQPPLIGLGIAMHAVFWLAMPVSTFSLTTLLLYLAWLDPDEVHGILERISGHPSPAR